MYSDYNSLAPGPMYPSALSNSHFSDPRRTISSPPLPSAHPLSMSGRPTTVTHDARTPIQRLGYLPVHQYDAPILRELVVLHDAELQSLHSQLQEADGLWRVAEDRIVAVDQLVAQGHLKKGCIEMLSAHAVRESVMHSRRGVQDRIAHLRKLTETHRGLLHPIRKLPTELLLMIMQCAVALEEVDRRTALFLPINPSSPRRPRSPPVRIDSLDEASNPNESPSARHYHSQPLPLVILLSQVCSDWRRTVHGTPALWRTIQFRLTGQPDVGLHNFDLVRHFMNKAKHDPNISQTSAHSTGMSLIFTGWVEHDHPPPNSSLQKILRMLAQNEGGRSPGETSITVAAAPSHNRRYSDAPSIIELSLTPESEEDHAINNAESALLPGPPDFTDLVPETVRPFRIDRLEIDFETLCEHEVIPGQNRSASYNWLTTCPKPREAVFIAHDNVYGAPLHGPLDDGHGQGYAVELLSPPYGRALIPHARDVTLWNLSFDWSTFGVRVDEPYANLTSLKLIYTRHFERLLLKPENMDHLGFLQFLKVGSCLVDLEIRLAVPTVPNTSSAGAASPVVVGTNGAPGMPPISIPAAFQRLTISFPDLCRLIPLFLPESSRPSAPTIHLPSFHYISFLPFGPRVPQDSWLVEKNADLVHQFLQTTEATITHLEFLQPEPSDFIAQKGATSSATLSPPRHSSSADSKKELVAFLLRQFHSCHTLEVWGDEHAKGVLSSLNIERSIDAPSISIVSGSDAPSILPPPSTRTSSSVRPTETAISRVQSEALRNHASSSSAPQSGASTGTLSPSPGAAPPAPPPSTSKSPNKLSKPPKPVRRSSTIKTPQRKHAFGGVLSTFMDIIANFPAPVTRLQSPAIVESPVGTPKMLVADDLPAQPVPDFVHLQEMHDPGLLAPPTTVMANTNAASMYSSVSGTSVTGTGSHAVSRSGTSSQVDASSAHGEEEYAASSTSRDGQSSNPRSQAAGEDAGLFPSLKRIVVHDTPCFAPGVVRSLGDRGIDVVVHG